ncbi:RluA family pseudouridine synthase [Thauera sp. WH-2]|uniref:RluA family pseudouridine synthase n=1 Tax=unclassified Thauera TaxID=2609274 RepID=UPI003AAB178F
MPTVLHLDPDLLVVDKPAGLLSVPARGADRQDCLAARVQALHPDALIVHRLDAATSGLVLFARGLEMLRRMSLAFEQRMVGKEYLAVVQGHLAHDAGEIDLPLGEDAAHRPRQVIDPLHGRRSLTRYRVLARVGKGAEARTRVALKPVTGRAHQLRVHLQALGHPILGDPLYAPPDQAAHFARMHLHATRIAFIHPRTRIPLKFESPVPF